MDNGACCYHRFLSGDKDGLADIMRIYRDGLTLYINSMVHDMHTAEELMEDTFVKLYVKKPKFNGKSTFRTWLYSIARFTAVDWLRKNAKAADVPIDEAYDLSDDVNIEHDFVKNEEKSALRKTILKLKPEYGQVLFLKYFEEFTNDEIAEIMKKSNKQIRDLLYNASKALKNQLEKEGYVYEKL